MPAKKKKSRKLKEVKEAAKVVETAELLTACGSGFEEKIELTGTAARDKQRIREQNEVDLAADEGKISDKRFVEIRTEIAKQHQAMSDRADKADKSGNGGILDNTWNLDAVAPTEWHLFIALKNQLRGLLVSGDLAAGIE